MRSTTAVVNTNEYINRASSRPEHVLATTFFGEARPGVGTLLYFNGGHPPVVIIAPDGTIKNQLVPYRPGGGHVPLAQSSKSWTPTWNRATSCLANTDGVTDARKPAGEAVSRGGLLSLISTRLSRSANGLLDRINNALYNYIAVTRVQFRRHYDGRRPPHPLIKLSTTSRWARGAAPLFAFHPS